MANIISWLDAPTPNTFNQIIDGFKGNGVYTGLAVSQAPGGASMHVSVAAGTGKADGTPFTDAGDLLEIEAAHATYPRKDIIVVSGAGLAVVKGTPAPIFPAGALREATTSPQPPLVPSGTVWLADVWVAAATTAILTADIADRRLIISAGGGTPSTGGFMEHESVEVDITTIVGDNTVLELPLIAGTSYALRNLLLTFPDPEGADSFAVKISELVNGVLVQTNAELPFTVTTTNFGTYSLMDICGRPEIVGDHIKIEITSTVISKEITGQYSYADATTGGGS